MKCCLRSERISQREDYHVLQQRAMANQPSSAWNRLLIAQPDWDQNDWIFLLNDYFCSSGVLGKTTFIAVQDISNSM